MAVSVALLLGFLAPGSPVEAAGEPRPATAPFGTMVVNGFLVPIPGPTNDQLVMHPVARISGDLAPKSVVASGTGLYLAQNMMYRHTISVLDHTKRVVKTIDDSVNLREFGYDASGDVYRGAPVEAAFTSDGSFAFVSNYRMYGPGYDPQAGSDRCGKDQGQDSFVYRIDTTALAIDRVYPVGPVPKHLAVTPDNRLLVVSNWCGFDVTVIDLVTHEDSRGDRRRSPPERRRGHERRHDRLRGRDGVHRHSRHRPHGLLTRERRYRSSRPGRRRPIYAT